MKIKVILLSLILVTSLGAKNSPELFLLKNYKTDSNCSGMLMSEKLDGVRAYWNGKKLLSRNGKLFNAPLWFIQDFPSFELDGELWTKRSDFEHIVSIVNRKHAHDGWRDLKYYIFEVPHAKGALLQRLEKIKEYLKKTPNDRIRVIEQQLCRDRKHLQRFMSKVQEKKGEGVVLRDTNVPYHTGRTVKDLKVKPYEDQECQVIGFKEGKGKFLGKMGALECQLTNGKSFFIGSGFNQKERENPPKVGALITFKYYGYTKNGIPRFPVFLRIRP